MAMDRMKYFFEPESIAIIGASNNPKKFGHVIIRNLIENKFKGKIFPVNLKEKEIMGFRCFSSVKKIKDRVDLAVVVVPPEFSNKVVKECVEKKVKGVIIITSGYKEIGGIGVKRELELERIIEKGDTRVVGPNCLGVWDAFSGVDTLFLPDYKLKRPEKGNIGIISQSGAFGSVILDMASDQKIGISRFISYGNATDVSEVDLLDYLKRDDKTRAVVAYIEGVKNGGGFLKKLKEITRKKPVIILKAGKSEKGSKAATSHTGSLAGSYEVYKGVFKQFGAIEAKTVEELFDFSKVLTYTCPLKGNKIAVVTNGGGFGVLSTDSIEQTGLELPEFEERSKRALKEILPPYATVHNPLDLIGDADPERYKKALEILRKDKNIDGILIVALLQTATMNSGIIDILNDFKSTYKKPFVVCLAGGEYTKIHAKNLEENLIPTFQIPNRAAYALKALYDYEKYLRGWSFDRKKG